MHTIERYICTHVSGTYANMRAIHIQTCERHSCDDRVARTTQLEGTPSCVALVYSSSLHGSLNCFAWLAQWFHMARSIVSYGSLNCFAWLAQWFHNRASRGHSIRCGAGILELIAWLAQLFRMARSMVSFGSLNCFITEQVEGTPSGVALVYSSPEVGTHCMARSIVSYGSPNCFIWHAQLFLRRAQLFHIARSVVSYGALSCFI